MKRMIRTKLSVTASKRVVNCASSTFTVQEIADSLYDCAPELVDDMLYGMDEEQLQEMWSVEDFKYYLESKAEEGRGELEFESDTEIDEWVKYIIDNSIFKKKSSTGNKKKYHYGAHNAYFLEENDEGQQNKLGLTDDSVSKLLWNLSDFMHTGKYLRDILPVKKYDELTPEVFARAVEEYNNSPGAWSIIQVKLDDNVIAGLEDNEIQ